MPESVTYNMDCVEYLKTVPDKYFDLAVCDPPYGGGFTEGGGRKGWFSKYHQDSGGAADAHTSGLVGGLGEYKGAIVGRFGGHFEKYHLGDPDGRDTGGEVRKKIISWDVAPGQEYFDELSRVSRNQIIWGGNYFNLPPTRCFLVWRKLSISETFTMAMAEYAWTSFNDNAKVFEAAPQGAKDDPRFHPTQKPVELYAWIYKLFAKPGDKILDTHLGSGSSRIAAWDAGLDFTGVEIDPVYFRQEEERFERHTAQMNLFIGE